MTYRGSTSTNRDKYTDQERGGGGVSKKFLSKVLFYRRDAKSVVNDLLDGPTFSWIYDLAPPPPPLAKFQRHITNRGELNDLNCKKLDPLYFIQYSLGQ